MYRSTYILSCGLCSHLLTLVLRLLQRGRYGSIHVRLPHEAFWLMNINFPSVKENEEAYDYYKIQPRVLVNVDNVNISGETFGFKTALPLGFSPAAMHGLAHPDGEIATSRAAAKMGICMGLSSYATASLEDVISQGAGNPYVMQLCILKDRSITLQILQRAEGAFLKSFSVRHSHKLML